MNLQNRYCGHESFDVLVHGGRSSSYYNARSNVAYILNSNDLSRATVFTESDSFRSRAVFLNGRLYFITRSRRKSTITVSSYSVFKREWSVPETCSKAGTINNACAFVNKVYVLCTFGRSQKLISFDPKTGDFEDKAKIKIPRRGAACSVFNGRIVVLGGRSVLISVEKKSAEAYDASSNRWVRMPDMLEKRSFHTSAAVRNKLHVFGGHQNTSCEVLDVISDEFARVKADFLLERFAFDGQVGFVGPTVALGNKILLFNATSLEFVSFDVEEFSEVEGVSSDGGAYSDAYPLQVRQAAAAL